MGENLNFERTKIDSPLKLVATEWPILHSIAALAELAELKLKLKLRMRLIRPAVWAANPSSEPRKGLRNFEITKFKTENRIKSGQNCKQI